MFNQKGCAGVGMLMLWMLGVGVIAVGDNYRRSQEAKQEVKQVVQSSQICGLVDGHFECKDVD